MLAKSFLAWLALLGVMFLLGVLRQAWLVPHLGELRAHQVGTLLGCLIVVLVAFIFVRRFAPTPGQAIRIGILWLLLTVAFEFGFFHYVAGRPWAELLADYNLFRGRLWPLLLLTVLVSPYVISLFTKFTKSARSP